MRPLYFASGYFASGYFGQAADSGTGGGYFGARHFAGNYFGAGFYGPVTLSTSGINASLDATEAADTLTSSATVSVVVQPVFGGSSRYLPFLMPRMDPIVADLDVTERPDTCEATATLGFDPVAMDNDWLLLAA